MSSRLFKAKIRKIKKKHSFNFHSRVPRRWRLENLAIYFRTVQFNNSRGKGGGRGKKKRKIAVCTAQNLNQLLHIWLANAIFIRDLRKLSRDIYFKFSNTSLPSFSSVPRRWKKKAAASFFCAFRSAWSWLESLIESFSVWWRGSEKSREEIA